MHRRHALRLLAAAGAGTLAAGIPWSLSRAHDAAWFMVTSEPRRDVGRLRDALGVHSLDSFRITASNIEPAGQDLTMLRSVTARSGGILDPADIETSPARIRDLALALRRRSVPGSMLVSVEPDCADRRDDIVFEVDGRMVESIPGSGTWSRIEIDGLQGRTVFRLQNGRLHVTGSSCRHELCRRFGARANGRIICAPNRLVAHLPSGGAGLAGVTG